MINKIVKKIKIKFFPAYTSPLRKGKGKDFIFIHLNKTGGTSVSKAIGLPVINHSTAKEIINFIGKEAWEKAYKFAIVRNPWDKVVSHYKYRIKTNQTKMAENTISFKEWLKHTYGENKNELYYDKPKMFQPQNEWLKDMEGKINIDKIIKFETLNEEFVEVAKFLDIDPELPHLNKTSKSDYRKFYDETTKQIVADWFKEDIALFGYTFD